MGVVGERAGLDEPQSPMTAEPSQALAPAGSADARPWPEAVAHWLEALSEGSARLGRFLVLERVAAGGMGVVFAAYDPELDRKVALKVLREGIASATVRARIVREARAMAKLSHPNVAQVFEVGEYLGSTFIAMEFVQGVTLRRWQQEAPRRWQDVLGTYLQAGRGLAAAHAEGLVHRDFKPDNAMIGRDGRVRVLDFGLVRAEEPGPSLEDATESHRSEPEAVAVADPLTKTGAMLGTPAYMAPEQLLGEPVDPRTDQFGFCVSLYEALYGERPYEGRSPAALCSSMVEGAVRPPPKGTKVPAALRRVLLRGLAREPAARWPSMGALLAELHRLVAPRRWRWAALGLTAGLAVLGAGLIASRYVEVMHRCEGAAEQLAGIWDDAREQAVRDAILGTGLAYAPDTWQRVDARLDEHAGAWSEKHTEVCEATSVRQEQSTEVMDLRMECLRQQRLVLRETVDVLAEADATRLEQAVAVVAGLSAPSQCDDVEALRAELPPPEDPEVAREVEALREPLAESWALHEAGAYDRALAVAEAVVQRAEALGYAPFLAEALAHRAAAHERKAEYAKAEADAERAYALGMEHGHGRATIDAAYVLLRVVGIEQARFDAGLQWGKMALPLARRPEGEPVDVARVIHVVGDLVAQQGKLDEALEHHRRALAIKQEALGPDHLEVAISLGNTGLVLWEQGKLDEALEHHQRALAIKQEALGPRHPSIAASLSNVGLVLKSQGKLDEALDCFQQALGLEQEAYGPRHPNVAMTISNIAGVAYARGDLDEVLDRSRHVLAIREEAYGPHHPKVADSLYSLGSVLRTQGRIEEALDHYQRALEIRQEVYDPRHPKVADSLGAVGAALTELGREAEALDHHQRALEIRQEVYGPRHPKVAQAFLGLGSVLRSLKRLPEALDYYQRALAIDQEAYGPRARDVGVTLMAIGRVLASMGRLPEALDHQRRALAIFEDVSGARHPDLAYPLAYMAEISLAQRDLEAAREHAERADGLVAWGDVSPYPLAQARFVLARVLWGDRSQRARARTLAEQARDAYVGLADVDAETLAEVQAWLADHQGP